LQHEIVSAFEANAPKRLAQQFIALPTVEFVEKIFEISGRRLLIPFQAKQPRDFGIVEFVHFFALLRDRIFPKFVQVVLQLPIRVKEPRTYRSFRNAQDFTDFCVGHPLNMEHGDNCSVIFRQFHHCLVQSSLQL
jgi:hypothetical protein